MVTPFPYQAECLDTLDSARKEGRRQALVVMASGLGKTVTAALDSKKWLAHYGGRLLYLCHQKDILGQARSTFESIFGDTHSYGYFHGLEKNVHEIDCVFASFQTMTRSAAHLFRPDEFDYVVVDESHHTHATTYFKVVEYFKPRFLLGITATPDRRDGQNIRSVYGREVYYLPLEEAMVRELVTPVDYRLVTDEIAQETLKDCVSGIQTVKEIDDNLFIPRRDEEIAAVIERHAKEFVEPKIIVFAGTIDRTEQLAKSIQGGAPVHSKVPVKERMIRIELFRQGLIKTVLTVDCFNEGIDIPQANVIVFLRSTTSPTIFFQQLGRGLRRYEGKDKVIVLDFVGNCDRITMLKDLSDKIDNRRRAHRSRETTKTAASHRTSEAHAPQISETSLIRFDEKAIKVLDVIKRIRPRRITDIPELLIEYSAHNTLLASAVSARAYRQVWWACSKCGYEWQMSPQTRLTGKGCPKCEQAVTALNNLSSKYPSIAKEFSAKNGVTPDQIRAETGEIFLWTCLVCGDEFKTSPKNRTSRGDRCPKCTGTLPTYKDNIALRYPELAAEYSDLNFISPECVSASSNKKRIWVCGGCGFRWEASAKARVSGKAGCPTCMTTIATGENNMAVTHPHLADEYSSRNRRPATTVLARTKEKLWWLCPDCGHYWQATGFERLIGTKCPFCKQEKFEQTHKC